MIPDVTPNGVFYLPPTGWLTSFYNPPFEKGRNTDELFIQTILGNVKAFSDRMIRPRRFIDWSAGLAHPKVLTMFDYQRMIMSDAFFARKFDASIDKEIIDKVVLGVKNED